MVGMIVVPPQVRRRQPVVPGDRPPPGVVDVEAGELEADERRLDLTHPEVLADVDVDVLLGHPVDAEAAHRVGERLVVGRHGATVADAAQVLGRVERVDRRRAGDRPQRTVGLRGILDDRDAERRRAARGRPGARTGAPARSPGCGS